MRYYRLAGLYFGLASLLPGQIQQSTRSTPGQVCGLTKVAAVAAGGIGGLALKTDGTVWEWYGPSPPAQVSGLSSIVAIAAGIGHSMALKSDGTVWEWTGPWGGSGSERLTRTPLQVSDVAGVVAIAAHESRSLAVKADGAVWEWTVVAGVAAETPYQVAGFGGGVSSVSVAFKRPFPDLWFGDILLVRSLALQSDGTVWFWDEGEMGMTKLGMTQPPTQVSGLTDVLAISASDPDSSALRSDGTVWEWSHAYGWWWDSVELPPFQVIGLTGVVAVAAGGAHQLALKSDGTVWAWGHNEDGQLGDGTTAYRASPVQVSGMGEVAQIAAASAGGAVSLAVRRDGTVWSWGETWNAWLGDGTTCEDPKPGSDSRLR